MRDLSASQDDLGDVPAALVEFRASFEIARRLAQQDPETPDGKTTW
jgi:hypothetical protein